MLLARIFTRIVKSELNLFNRFDESEKNNITLAMLDLSDMHCPPEP